MMIVSMQCKKCMKYYNGAAEKQCPYCGETGRIDEKKLGVPIMEEEVGKKTAPLTGGIVEESNQKPVSIPAPVQKPVAVPPVTPSIIPSAVSTSDSLQGQISRAGKTIGKFFSDTKESVEPVMGWLVCVKGTYFGKAFNLINGKNRIGRAPDMNVNLENDNSISSTCMASIMYDSKGNRFSIIPGESSKLCYVNNEALYERKTLVGFEEIEFGDAEYNKFVFVPLCGEHFQWADYKK